MDNNLLTRLPLCTSEEEIYDLLNNQVFPQSDGSQFGDDIMRFKTSTGEYMNVNINLEGIAKLAFNTILLFKLHGHLGIIPSKSGTRTYVTILAKIIKDIFAGANKRIDEITLDKFEEFQKKRMKEISFSTLKEYIMRVYDWISFANPLLPYILRVDERLYTSTSTTSHIFENARLEEKKYSSGVGGIKNRLFPFDVTKNIMKSALDYIENFSDEILMIAKVYLDRKNMDNDYLERKFIIDYFKEIDHIFEEPILKQLQSDSLNILSHKIKSPAKRLLSTIRQLEGGCIFVSLSLTGYRASEFVKIKRFPKFRQEEHLYLTRLVTKTSVNEEGEEIEMPIPLSAKNSIEIISELTSLFDNKKSGNLLMNSWENLKVNNVISASQRLSLAINYFCSKNDFISPSPHMLRHTMAFIIVYLSEGDSIELARLFLGHKSITMTLRYLGHFNKIYQESINEFEKNEAEYNAKLISNEIRYGNKIYGLSGERIMNAQFTGVYVEEFADLLELGLIEMVKISKYIILNTPYCYCIHDKSTTDSMPCQQGINFNEIENSMEFKPLTGQCNPGSCGNAVFTEKNLSSIQANQLLVSIPDEFKDRISKNIYFLNDDSIEELDNPLKKIIKQFNADKI